MTGKTTSDSVADESATSSTTSATRGKRFPNRWVLAFVAFCALVIAAIRYFDTEVQSLIPVIDPAIINIVTLIVGFLAFVALFGWFVGFSGYSGRFRRWSAIGLFVFLVALIVAVRLDGVDGNLRPHFAWRWSASADHHLKPIEAEVQSAPGVDLTQTTASDFPQFLGPDRSCRLPETHLKRDWEAHPPKLLWKQPIGAGWSAFSVVQDYAFTLEQRGEEEWITCYEVKTGKPVWGYSIKARYETKLGGIGPRSTPTIDEGRVYALGATGVLSCLDAATGELLWQKNLLEVIGMTVAEDLAEVSFGRSASPLTVDSRVVMPLGGKEGAEHSLIAFDKVSGKVAWMQGPRQISYASPALATLGGQRQILIVNEETVAGHRDENGEELWTFPWPGSSSGDASCSQAIAFGNDQVFVSKGYGYGSAVYQIKNNGDEGWTATEVWSNRRVLRTKFTNVAIIDGYVYGLSDGILECADLATGKSQWKKGRYRNGQLLGLNSTLLVISEDGKLIHLEATPEEHRELGQMDAIEGQTWNNLCLSGNRLLVRNGQEAACFELALEEAK